MKKLTRRASVFVTGAAASILLFTSGVAPAFAEEFREPQTVALFTKVNGKAIQITDSYIESHTLDLTDKTANTDQTRSPQDSSTGINGLGASP
ncbi:hypothetical protein [Lysinibacter sp. HNR]|uniref:hypothetical protein n=1 Tax=Lysinibacter sp. HNR TaxID=3031408 RepID=UPI002435D202|nr:hypothetical protein [Lysinibacter sp. HNR]WGD37766.1 hypothetical protein FrondiHNR_02300 [Lysinibacter sp. HNR]